MKHRWNSGTLVEQRKNGGTIGIQRNSEDAIYNCFLNVFLFDFTQLTLLTHFSPVSHFYTH